MAKDICSSREGGWTEQEARKAIQEALAYMCTQEFKKKVRERIAEENQRFEAEELAAQRAREEELFYGEPYC